MVENQIIVYPVKVQGNERKAIDVESMNNWLENQIIGSNPLLLDPKQIEGVGIQEYKGIISWGILIELSNYLKKEMGLMEEQAEVIEPEVEEQPEPPKVEEQAKVVEPEVVTPELPKKEEAKPVEAPASPTANPEPVDDSSEDIVTLD